MTVSETQPSGSRRYPTVPMEKRFSELSARQLHDILALRSGVFIVEQECVYNDIDGRDIEPTTRHLWIDHDGAPAAYLRQLHDRDGVIRVGRVVTDPGHRGQGLAARLVRHVTERQSGQVVLDAQAHLHNWYAQLGFVRDGDDFVEDGIAHIPMRLDSVSHAVE